MVNGERYRGDPQPSPFTDAIGDKVGERSRLTKSGKQGFEPLSFRFAMYSQPAFAKANFGFRNANCEFEEQS